MTPLDDRDLLHGKCHEALFREHVLPLLYNALDSERAAVSTGRLKDFARKFTGMILL